MVNDTSGRIGRSVIQLVAAGGLTALVAAVADGLSPVGSAGLLAISALAVIVAQNLLEEKNVIPTILKPKPVGVVTDEIGEVVADVVAPAAGLVEAVTGTIIDETGEIVGAVATADGPEEGQ